MENIKLIDKENRQGHQTLFHENCWFLNYTIEWIKLCLLFIWKINHLQLLFWNNLPTIQAYYIHEHFFFQKIWNQSWIKHRKHSIKDSNLSCACCAVLANQVVFGCSATWVDVFFSTVFYDQRVRAVVCGHTGFGGITLKDQIF